MRQSFLSSFPVSLSNWKQKQQLQEHKTVQNRLNKNRSITEKIVTNTHTGKKNNKNKPTNNSKS